MNSEMKEIIQQHVNNLDEIIKEISKFLDALEFASIYNQEKKDLETWRTKLVGFYKNVSDLNVHLSPLLNEDFKRIEVKFKNIDNRSLEEVFDISEFVLRRLNAYINPISIQISILQDIEAQKSFRKSIIYSIYMALFGGIVASLIASTIFSMFNNESKELKTIEANTNAFSTEIKKQPQMINHNSTILEDNTFILKQNTILLDSLILEEKE